MGWLKHESGLSTLDICTLGSRPPMMLVYVINIIFLAAGTCIFKVVVFGMSQRRGGGGGGGAGF